MCWITTSMWFHYVQGVFDKELVITLLGWWMEARGVILSSSPEKASPYILNWKAKSEWEEIVRNKPENSTAYHITGYVQFSRRCASFKYFCFSVSASVGSPFIKLECTEGTSMGVRVHLGCVLWYVCELTRLKCLVFHYKITSWI